LVVDYQISKDSLINLLKRNSLKEAKYMARPWEGMAGGLNYLPTLQMNNGAVTHEEEGQICWRVAS